MKSLTLRWRDVLGVWLLLIVATAVVPARAVAQAYRLKVVTDRSEAIYATGERATFQVTVTQGEKPVSAGKVTYKIDDFVAGRPASSEYPQGVLKLEGKTASISVKSDKPGFLRCQVTFQTPEKKTLRAVASAAFSPLKIGPSLPVPDDFDAFWAKQKKLLAEVPMEAKLTPVKQANAAIECFDVQLQCLGGAPVSGYFGKPKNAKPKSLPAILWVHGAGVRSSSMGTTVTGANAGMLSMDINAHGIANGKPAAFYKELTAGRLKNYRYAGRESREQSYFRGMYLRLVRAIDFLTAQPEWDGKIVAVIGHSQGGGQSLVAGGLDDRVTMIATGVPAICDHSGRVADRINGWPKLVPSDVDGKPDATILQAARYVDAVNFASRCRADAIMSVGFIDPVCPPSSCYAAYNNLKGDKQVINEPLMSHAAPAPIKEAFFKRILQHIEQSKSAKK